MKYKIYDGTLDKINVLKNELELKRLIYSSIESMIQTTDYEYLIAMAEWTHKRVDILLDECKKNYISYEEANSKCCKNNNKFDIEKWENGEWFEQIEVQKHFGLDLIDCLSQFDYKNESVVNDNIIINKAYFKKKDDIRREYE